MCLCLQSGWTALHSAARVGRKIDVVRQLIEAKAHVDLPAKVHIYILIICLLIFSVDVYTYCIFLTSDLSSGAIMQCP